MCARGQRMNDADIIREEYEAALADATWYERRRIESRGRFVPALDRLVNGARKQDGLHRHYERLADIRLAKVNELDVALREAQTERDERLSVAGELRGDGTSVAAYLHFRQRALAAEARVQELESYSRVPITPQRLRELQTAEAQVQ